MSLYRSLLIAAMMVSSHLLFASQIVMQNGDKLTGTIEKSDDNALVIKTDYAGAVSVQLSAIQAIDSDKPLHVSLQNGQKAVGLVKTTDGKLEVQTSSGSSVPVTKETIKYIRSDDEEAAEHLLELDGLRRVIQLLDRLARPGPAPSTTGDRVQTKPSEPR